MKVSLNINFPIVNQCNCYQICDSETLISWLSVETCDKQVSISYFDQILGKWKSQTRQLFNFTGI